MNNLVVVSQSLSGIDMGLPNDWSITPLTDLNQIISHIEDVGLLVFTIQDPLINLPQVVSLIKEYDLQCILLVEDDSDYRSLKQLNAINVETVPVQLIEQLPQRVQCSCQKQDLNNRISGLQTQLFQSEKMAALGQLAAGVAHEINNPIGFVSSNVNLLGKYIGIILEEMSALEEILEAEETGMAVLQYHSWRSGSKFDHCIENIREIVEESEDGLSRIRDIVKDLKEHTHIGSQQFESTDLNKLIQSTVNLLRNEIKYKAEVKYNFDELEPIDAIPSQLSQVFVNIIMNACQAIDEYGQLSITTESDKDDVEISIKDSGSGIEKDKLEKIFEPFFTTKAVGQGTGIGLAITKAIVERHAGQIRVYSMIGEGTTFVIHLPVHQVITDEANEPD
jgi:signal transduction histidine kinase